MAQITEEAIHRVLKVRRDDIIIAFTGLTGVGKSTFISLLVNQQDDQNALNEIGHDLISKTSGVQATRVVGHPIFGDRIVLLDTPGFGDTYKPDTKMRELIGNWMKEKYQKQGIKLDAFVYLHRITDNRETLSMISCLTKLQEIREEAGGILHFVTTMWDSTLPQEERLININKEKELAGGLWKSFLSPGAPNPDRLEAREPREAWRIIDQLISRSIQNRVKRIQGELDDLKYQLSGSPACEDLYRKLHDLIEKHARDSTSIMSTSQERKEAYDKIRGQLQEFKIPPSKWKLVMMLLSKEFWRAKNVKTGGRRSGDR